MTLIPYHPIKLSDTTPSGVHRWTGTWRWPPVCLCPVSVLDRSYGRTPLHPIRSPWSPCTSVLPGTSWVLRSKFSYQWLQVPSNSVDHQWLTWLPVGDTMVFLYSFSAWNTVSTWYSLGLTLDILSMKEFHTLLKDTLGHSHRVHHSICCSQTPNS